MTAVYDLGVIGLDENKPIVLEEYRFRFQAIYRTTTRNVESAEWSSALSVEGHFSAITHSCGRKI